VRARFTEAVARAGTYVRLIDSFDPRGQRSDAGIIAHVNVLGRMSSPTGAEAVAAAWPIDTYFTEWAPFVNGEALQLVHIPKAHTDGDTMVFFRRSDVISTGDIFSTSRSPALRRGEGGSVVIPGHARLSDETEVANYRDIDRSRPCCRDALRAERESRILLRRNRTGAT
jgi:hypothetical protein